MSLDPAQKPSTNFVLLSLYIGVTGVITKILSSSDFRFDMPSSAFRGLRNNQIIPVFNSVSAVTSLIFETTLSSICKLGKKLSKNK
jgi:hypothetical protein